MRMGFPEDQEVVIGDVKVRYYQKCDMTEALQELKISTVDQGAGTYFVIKTKRWAINDIDELIKIFEDFKNRIK